MAEYHVGCGALAIYAGTLNSRNKSLMMAMLWCIYMKLLCMEDK